MAQGTKQRLLDMLGASAAVAFALVMAWLHYQQLLAGGYYYSDLPAHMQGLAMGNTGFSLVTVILQGLYAVGGNFITAVFLALAHLATLLLTGWALQKTVPQICPGAALLWALAATLCQAVWLPVGGYWYFGTVTGTIYHNTTYILLQPLALAAFLLFLSLFDARETMPWGRWLALTALLTVATAIKPSYLFAFAPALLIALVVDLIRTRGRALRQEVWLGCTVLPGILLCIVQAKVLFTGDSTSGIALIFGAEFDPERMKWGISNYYAKWALLRSFVFVGAVFVLLIGQWRRSFGYRFSLLLFAVALCEGLCLTETGERMYDGNLWWGSFICYYLWLLASLAVWLRGLYGRRTALGTGCTAVCGAALAWHIVSGVAFLVMMLAGISYAVMLGTGGLLLQEMWSMTL